MDPYMRLWRPPWQILWPAWGRDLWDLALRSILLAESRWPVKFFIFYFWTKILIVLGTFFSSPSICFKTTRVPASTKYIPLALSPCQTMCITTSALEQWGTMPMGSLQRAQLIKCSTYYDIRTRFKIFALFFKIQNLKSKISK